MTKVTVPKHLHLYKRVDLRPKWKQIKNPDLPPFLVFRCQKPACMHWIEVSLALNKICECNVCHNPMILDKETIKKARPRCSDCIVRKTKKEVTDLSELLKDI
jgi:hypothetical protein